MTTYTWTDNAMQGGTSCDVDKVNDNLMYLKDAIANLSLSFKEYGLALSHQGSNVVRVAAGQRYADDHITQLTIAQTDYTLSDGTNNTLYYLWMGKNNAGTVVLEKDTSPAGDNLSTIIGAKTCLGRFKTQAASGNIDTNQLWIKHSDGTESDVYQQSTGNFPNASVTLTHNLGSKNILVIPRAVKNSDSAEYDLMSIGTRTFNPIKIVDNNSITVQKGDSGFYIMLGGTLTDITNSADYRMKILIKTLGV